MTASLKAQAAGNIVQMTGVQIRPMQLEDLDAVMQIEPVIYSHPWTRGKFSDSLQSGYSAWVMIIGGHVVGYSLMMMVLDEAHLLNVSVRDDYQKQGFGRALLTHMMDKAKYYQANEMLLEVRASNLAAITLYEAAGFTQIGIRKGYYPAASGREDAVIMKREL